MRRLQRLMSVLWPPPRRGSASVVVVPSSAWLGGALRGTLPRFGGLTSTHGTCRSAQIRQRRRPSRAERTSGPRPGRVFEQRRVLGRPVLLHGAARRDHRRHRDPADQRVASHHGRRGRLLPDTGAAFVEDDAINLDSHRYTQSPPNDCRWVAAARLE